MLDLFSVPSPFSKYPDKSNHNNQKNMYLDLPRERIYVCVQKFFLDLGTHNAKCKYLNYEKICLDLQPISKHSESTLDQQKYLSGSGAITKYQKYRNIYLDLGPSQNIRNIAISTCICGPSLETLLSSALLSPELVFPGSTFFALYL